MRLLMHVLLLIVSRFRRKVHEYRPISCNLVFFLYLASQVGPPPDLPPQTFGQGKVVALVMADMMVPPSRLSWATGQKALNLYLRQKVTTPSTR